MDILDRIIDYVEENVPEVYAVIQSLPLAPEAEAISMTLDKSSAARNYLTGKMEEFFIKIQAKSLSGHKAYRAAQSICDALERAKKDSILSHDGSFDFVAAQTRVKPYLSHMQANQTCVYEAGVKVFADC